MHSALSILPAPTALVATLLLPLGACLTVAERHVPAAPATAVAALPGEAWTAHGGTGEELGFVVRFEEAAPDLEGTPRTFLSVRNRHGQELGLVDDLGRAWRYRPHALDPAWVGTGSVAEGVARILLDGPPGASWADPGALPTAVVLEPVPLEALKVRLCLQSFGAATRQGT